MYLGIILMKSAAAVALEESNLENIRLMQHKDREGKLISKSSEAHMLSTKRH